MQWDAGTTHLPLLQVGNRWGLYLAILGVSNALGCFAGPLVAGAVTSIRTPGGTFACDASSDQCCITAVRYFVNGCVLYHGVPWNAAMAGVYTTPTPNGCCSAHIAVTSC
jgi:hypothetical protein